MSFIFRWKPSVMPSLSALFGSAPWAGAVWDCEGMKLRRRRGHLFTCDDRRRHGGPRSKPLRGADRGGGCGEQRECGAELVFVESDRREPGIGLARGGPWPGAGRGGSCSVPATAAGHSTSGRDVHRDYGQGDFCQPISASATTCGLPSSRAPIFLQH